MQLTLHQRITLFAHMLQEELFPRLEQMGTSLSETHKRITAILSVLPLRRYIPVAQGWNGRPAKDRYALAASFVAKAVLNLSTTRQLIDRLAVDATLRQLCGWDNNATLPHESTFSRAFAEFAEMQLPQSVHEALIDDTQRERLIGHIARDSTAIEARERLALPTAPQASARRKAAKKKKTKPSRKGKKLRFLSRQAKRAEQIARTATARQRSLSLAQALAEIPRACGTGAKADSHGNIKYWRGYKLHLDVADGQIPITALLSSAQVHDSQLAIPMSQISTQRVTYCYELMDAAYDAQAIREQSRELGHVPIIDSKTPGGRLSALPLRRKRKREFHPAETIRYRERTMVERVYSRLKDEFGASAVRVRGAQKVMSHLMFGVLALTADQLLRLAG